MNSKSQEQQQHHQASNNAAVNHYKVPPHTVDSNGLQMSQHHQMNPLQFKQNSNNSRNPSNLDFMSSNPNDVLFQQRQSSNLFVPNLRQPIQQLQYNNNLPQRFTNTHYNNTIGDDNDISTNLKPLFKNYNIDITQWPLTNPPIFENILSTQDDSDYLNNNSAEEPEASEIHPPFHGTVEKDRRRRRVSISNGQIDQLNNDLLQMDQLYCSQPPLYPRLLINNMLQSNTMVNTNSYEEDPNRDNLPSNEDDSNKVYSNRKNSQEPITVKSESDGGKLRSSSSNQLGKKGGAKRILPPSNTLIPGTPEYKKARLLERNRIAAMKCRQRKKVERDIMVRDYDRIIAENKDLKRKVQELEALLIGKN